MRDNLMFWLGHEGEQLADDMAHAEFFAACDRMCPGPDLSDPTNDE